MSATQAVEQPVKYSYKYKLVPEKPREQETEELNERQIQDYIDNLLGVDSKRYASNPDSAGDISR